MDVQLKVLVGSAKGQKIKVVGPKFFVGRSEDCQLRPKSDLISRHHCALILEGDYLAIRDFGSKNGTYVNGERVVGEQELNNGDKLTIGPLEFEVRVEKVSIAGPKRPKVQSISEAAARQAESAPRPVAAADPTGDVDISDWLAAETVGETREIKAPETSEFKLDQTLADTPPQAVEPPPPHRPTEKRQPGKLPKLPPTAASSEDAATEVLRKLRRFR